jgi:hypothetical protein
MLPRTRNSFNGRASKLRALENRIGHTRTIAGPLPALGKSRERPTGTFFSKPQNSVLVPGVQGATHYAARLALLMLISVVEWRCLVMKGKTIRLFRLGTALLVLSGVLSLQACFFYDGGGHWHHEHHWHHGHYDDR